MISEHASPLAAVGGTDTGGQNVYVAQVARHLGAMGYQVDVFTRRDAEDQPTVVDWLPGVRVLHVPAGPASAVPKEDLLPFMDAFTQWTLARWDGQPYDLVHANFWMSGLVAADLKRLTKVPFVITFHALGKVRKRFQGAADESPEERSAVEERIVAEADRIIAECPQDHADLLTLYRADPKTIEVIPCGFDPAELQPIPKPMARARIGLPSAGWLILQLGRMVPRKGVDNVIRALARLIKDEGIPAHLLVVGGNAEVPDPQLTPELGRLQRLAEAEGVAEAVTFTGRRPREVLRYYYSAADVFVTTPWYEPFGITPLEAMACGVPVVGTNVGGVKFSVVEGETGYLVPASDPEALAERLAALHHHPERAVLFGRRGLERVNRLFTWDRVARSIASLYERVLAPLEPVQEPSRGGAVEAALDELVHLLAESRSSLRPSLVQAASVVVRCLQGGGKVLVAGNGGSAAQAQHLAAELVGRFRHPGRRPLPVISLTADTAVLTAWANDAGYADVFARQVEALGAPDDLLVGISTSGRSENVLEAFAQARRLGLRTLALVGGDGGPLRRLADVAVTVPSLDTQRVQEVHLLAVHLLCQLVEEQVVAASPRPLLAVGQEDRPRPAAAHQVVPAQEAG